MRITQAARRTCGGVRHRCFCRTLPSPFSLNRCDVPPAPAQPISRRRPPRLAGRSRRRLVLASLATVVAILVAVATAIEQVGVSPRLLGPYLERRSSGHNAIIETIGQRVATLLVHIDRGRPEPQLGFPAWLPAAAAPAQVSASAQRPPIMIVDASQLQGALDQAQPGDVIAFAPGRYQFSGTSLGVRRAGRADAPITVRALQPGTVTLEFNLLEGFLVDAPHWIFEHLTIVGTCRDHSDCEHAFHVVGNGQHTVIRDNEMREFNAHLKINGVRGRFPDHGQVIGNRLFNTTARRTDNPVTLVDLVAASGWLIEGNLIADFVKDGGDFTSYGAFAKGGGKGNRFERNLVLCEHRLRGAAGRRIGLSFGGGGTGAPACRDGRCVVEHDEGTMHSNLIAACSDNGIYINRGAQSRLLHNTLIDTAGINVRFADSAAHVEGNLSDGPIRARDSASLQDVDNRVTPLLWRYLGLSGEGDLFADATTVDLHWHGPAPRRRSAAVPVSDLCGTPRPAQPVYGAFEDIGRCPPVAR